MAETKESATLYLAKRKELGWSREYASEQLGISDDKLERIENEKQLPNPQDVLIMSDVYHAPELCNYYCSRDCEIGQLYVPKVPGLAQAQYTLEQLSIMIEALQLCVERKIDKGEISKELYDAAYKDASAKAGKKAVR